MTNPKVFSNTADPSSVVSGTGPDGTAWSLSGGDGSAQLPKADDGLKEGEHVDQQYTNFNYWNNIGSYFPPEEPKKAEATSVSAAAGTKGPSGEGKQ